MQHAEVTNLNCQSVQVGDSSIIGHNKDTKYRNDILNKVLHNLMPNIS